MRHLNIIDMLEDANINMDKCGSAESFKLLKIRQIFYVIIERKL